jgi:sulfur carrier protein
MTIVVAGERKEYSDGLTVDELIEAEKVETPQYVTVTINDTFLTKAERASRILQEGDVVEFLYFMGGGADFS